VVWHQLSHVDAASNNKALERLRAVLGLMLDASVEPDAR
jgi:hypothetical protein